MLIAKVTALPGVIIMVGEKGICKSVPFQVILVMRAVDLNYYLHRMKLTIPSTVGLVSSSLLLCSLISDVLAQPSPDPKINWARKTRGRKHFPRDTYVQTGSTECVDSNATRITAPHENVWGELDDTEAAAVVQWLFRQSELNLTVSDQAGNWDNTILLVELMRPNKTDVLNYIDHEGAVPPLYAHVVIDHRASVEPYYGDLLVGPLPVKNGTTKWEPLEYPFTRKTQGRVRNLDADNALQQNWLYNLSASVSDITMDLWNGTALGFDNDTLDIWGIDPFWQDNGRIVRWDTWWNFPRRRV
jgi:primary-amine oxidase